MLVLRGLARFFFFLNVHLGSMMQDPRRSRGIRGVKVSPTRFEDPAGNLRVVAKTIVNVVLKLTCLTTVKGRMTSVLQDAT